MEKNVSKPIDETSFKPFLNTIQLASSNLPIEGDNDMILIAFAGPTTYELVSKLLRIFILLSILMNRQ
jgi:hypothetical protein